MVPQRERRKERLRLNKYRHSVDFIQSNGGELPISKPNIEINRVQTNPVSYNTKSFSGSQICPLPFFPDLPDPLELFLLFV